MGRRFGRNQKRAAREAVAKAQAEADGSRAFAESERRRAAGVDDSMRRLLRDVVELLGPSSAVLPEPQEVEVAGPRPWDDEWRAFLPHDRRDLLPFGAEPLPLAERRYEVLKRLRVKATRDEAARAMVVRVRWHGTEFGYSVADMDLYLSERAWRLRSVVDRVAEDIGRKVARAMAKEITGVGAANT